MEDLSGWGRFPVEECCVYRPGKRASLMETLTSGEHSSYISRGLGRSYGDAALNQAAGVISMSSLNRFGAFDADTGVLDCEAGVSLREIIEHFLPRGFFLPVTPGTKYVTVGGAIANDVHGKNHHRDGSFGAHVESLTLLTPGCGLIECSPTVHGDVFWATVGGVGLTGIILSARLRLCRVESAYLWVEYKKGRSLADTLEILADQDKKRQYSVAWVDLLAGASFGRSVIMLADHARAQELPAGRSDPLAPPVRRSRRMPVRWFSPLLNPTSMRVFNSSYYRSHNTTGKRLVDYDSHFYPLDAVDDWNRIYGRRGLVQCQVVVPHEGGYETLLAVTDEIRRAPVNPYLCVLKQLGAAGQGLLSFPMSGYTISVDYPVSDSLVALLGRLDRLVLDGGGRVYLAKDALCRPETFAGMYPGLETFLSIKSRLDPTGLMSSSLARRLGIVPS